MKAERKEEKLTMMSSYASSVTCVATASGDPKFGRVELPVGDDMLQLEGKMLRHGDPVLVQAAEDAQHAHLCVMHCVLSNSSNESKGEEGNELLPIARFHPLVYISTSSSPLGVHSACKDMTASPLLPHTLVAQKAVPLRSVEIELSYLLAGDSKRSCSSNALVGERGGGSTREDVFALLPGYVFEASSSVLSGANAPGLFLKRLLLYMYVCADAHVRLAPSCCACVRKCTPTLEPGSAGRITPATHVVVRSKQDVAATRELEKKKRPEKKERDGDASVPRQLRELLYFPVKHAALMTRLNLPFPKGVLLHGPPGVGKTHSVKVLGREFGCHVEVVDPSNTFGEVSGQTERNLRAAFTRAKFANLEKPVILFLDEIDVLCPSRDLSQSGVNTVVSQLLTLMDDVETFRSSSHPFLLLAATNLIDKVDRSLRRPGRFDREFKFRVPRTREKMALLRQLTKHMPIDADMDFGALARVTRGYVTADVVQLCHRAAHLASRERLSLVREGRRKEGEDKKESGGVALRHFEVAAQASGVGSLLRGATNLVSADDVKGATLSGGVSGMDDLKRRLHHLMDSEDNVFERLGASRPHGVLLYGPPGCGKTRLVASLADAADVSFFSFSGADVYNSYVGESERIVRDLFHQAQSNLPAVLFFDELDALVCDRGGKSNAAQESGGMELRVLATLLNEMDGISQHDGLLVVAASNRPGVIDRALLRPGRFDYLFYVPLPNEDAIRDMLDSFLQNTPLAEDVDVRGSLAARLYHPTAGYSGAELQAICKEASMFALSEQYAKLMDSLEDDSVIQHASEWLVAARHFDKAISQIKPATNAQDLLELQEFAKLHSNK